MAYLFFDVSYATARVKMFIVLLVLAVGLLTVPDPAPAQCSTPQGNAWLSFSGIPQIGGAVTLGLAGRAGQPFILAMDTQKGTMNIPGIGTICLTPGMFLLINGAPIPNSGPFTMQMPIPIINQLIGQTFYFQAAIADDQAPNKIMSISNLASVTLRSPLPVTSVFFEDFEVGQNYWFATNGLWQTGTPASKVGPSSAWSGTKCNGTNLAGQYPSRDANTRLVSPGIALPSVSTGEEIRMTLRAWFDTEDVRDACSLQVSTDMIKWTNLKGCPPISGWNKTWVQLNADLTSYAGQTVYLGFQFSSSDYRNSYGTWYPVTGDGVYIDDVHVFKGIPVCNTTEDWESGRILVGMRQRAVGGRKPDGRTQNAEFGKEVRRHPHEQHLPYSRCRHAPDQPPHPASCLPGQVVDLQPLVPDRGQPRSRLGPGLHGRRSQLGHPAPVELLRKQRGMDSDRGQPGGLCRQDHPDRLQLHDLRLP